MHDKYLIISKSYSNAVESIVYTFSEEKKETYLYIEGEHKHYTGNAKVINNLSDLHDFSNVIVVKYDIDSDVLKSSLAEGGSVINISDEANLAKNVDFKINYIKTNLVNDNNKYSPTEKEYLFKKSMYNVLAEQISYLLSEEGHYLDNTSIDISNCKTKSKDYIFEFESISESYAWLTKKTLGCKKMQILEFYMDRIFCDSDKEIKFCIDMIKSIENGTDLTQVYLCTKEEMQKLRNNMFFKILIKCKKGNKIYMADKEQLKKYSEKLYEEILYGIVVYDDCVYRDYFDNENTLGYVDCKEETIKKYNLIFDEIIEKVAKKVEKEDDINGIFQ